MIKPNAKPQTNIKPKLKYTEFQHDSSNNNIEFPNIINIEMFVILNY